MKTGKRWYLVPRPKRSVCVESRKVDDRYFMRKIADWCYGPKILNPYNRAQECTNLCQ